jgi:hypothetical protein
MSQLRALTVCHITGVSSFHVIPGMFYRVDASAGDVTARLPPAAATHPGDWNIIKLVSTSNGSRVVVIPAPGEQVNGTARNVLNRLNQGHQYVPGTPASFGTGWLSF